MRLRPSLIPPVSGGRLIYQRPSSVVAPFAAQLPAHPHGEPVDVEPEHGMRAPIESRSATTCAPVRLPAQDGGAYAAEREDQISHSYSVNTNETTGEVRE